MTRTSTPTATIMTLLLLATTATPLAYAEGSPNEEQRGDNSLCLDYNTYLAGTTSPLLEHLWILSERSPHAAIVDVDPGTWYKATVDEGPMSPFENQGDTLHVNFWDEDHASAGSFTGTHGTVPDDAAYATLCVGLLGAQPDADPPNPFATWTYQDGYADPYYEG